MKLDYQRQNGAADGTFLDRNTTPNNERPGTVIDAETFNQIIAETNNLIEAAGITPSRNELNQLLKAIKNIIHPIGYDYIQIAEDNGTFDINKSPAVLFGGTWSIRYNGDGVAMRTEGGNAEDGGRNGRGIQADAIRNVSGAIRFGGDVGVNYSLPATASGVFQATAGTNEFMQSGSHRAKWCNTEVFIDLSRQVPTGSENRMINIKMRLYRKIAN